MDRKKKEKEREWRRRKEGKKGGRRKKERRRKRSRLCVTYPSPPTHRQSKSCIPFNTQQLQRQTKLFVRCQCGCHVCCPSSCHSSNPHILQSPHPCRLFVCICPYLSASLWGGVLPVHCPEHARVIMQRERGKSLAGQQHHNTTTNIMHAPFLGIRFLQSG